MESILVIDEESGLLHTLTMILKRSGYISYAATNIKDILSNLQTNEINMMVVNDRFFMYNEPDMLMAINDTNPSIPILLLAGWLSVETTTLLQVQTGCAVLNKPFDPTNILMVVTDRLDQTN